MQVVPGSRCAYGTGPQAHLTQPHLETPDAGPGDHALHAVSPDGLAHDVRGAATGVGVKVQVNLNLKVVHRVKQVPGCRVVVHPGPGSSPVNAWHEDGALATYRANLVDDLLRTRVPHARHNVVRLVGDAVVNQWAGEVERQLTPEVGQHVVNGDAARGTADTYRAVRGEPSVQVAVDVQDSVAALAGDVVHQRRELAPVGAVVRAKGAGAKGGHWCVLDRLPGEQNPKGVHASCDEPVHLGRCHKQVVLATDGANGLSPVGPCGTATGKVAAPIAEQCGGNRSG